MVNGIGTGLTGAAGANGIYMDDATKYVEVSGNTVYNCDGTGMFLHHNTYVNCHDNTFYNCGKSTDVAYWGIDIVNQIPSEPIRHCRFAQNIVGSTYNTKALLYMAHPTTNIQTELSQFGSLDTNYYLYPVSTPQFYSTNWSNIFLTQSFAQWKLYSGKDSHSVLTTPTTTSDKVRFEYNATPVNKSVTLTGTYYDAKGVSYSGTITIQPYKSLIFYKN